MPKLFNEEQSEILRDIVQKALNCIDFSFDKLEDIADLMTATKMPSNAYLTNLTDIIRTSFYALERVKALLADEGGGDEEMLAKLRELAEQIVPPRGD